MKEFKAGYYEHYKGKKYLALGVAKHSETLEELVFYICLYENETGNGELWVRPKHMFLEDIEVDGKKIPRFKFLHGS